MEKQKNNPALSEMDGPMVVAIGASAGGLAALNQFFQALPANCGMIFLVITHLDPTRTSILPELLQRSTEMPVQTVTGNLTMQANHVYVNPPNQQLVVTDGQIDVIPFEKQLERRTPIDILFRSLADGSTKSTAIILSGGGTDGSVGSKFIKENGGLLLVQLPEEAEFDSMPRAAIASGMADAVQPVSELAATLVAYNKRDLQVPDDPDQFVNDDLDLFHQILQEILIQTGHDFKQYKHTTILRRINRRMRLSGHLTLNSYLGYLRNNPDETQALFNDLLIIVTSFFRDRDSWDTLAERVIPALFKGKKAGDTVRVWVAGCATGEEAYTMAILLLEYASTLHYPVQIQIFASDLNIKALNQARQGLYPQVIEADIPKSFLEKYFISEGNYYRVQQTVRDIILFANHNLLHDPPFSRIDLLCCRNLLIYLNRELQKRVFSVFHYALRAEGFLFLGNAETIEPSNHLFQTFDKSNCVFTARLWRDEIAPIQFQPVSFSRLKNQERPYLETTYNYGQKRAVDDQTIGTLHQESLEMYGPPTVLIDDTYTILHVSETAGRYLLQPKGMVTSDLLKLVRPELQLELSLALFQAFEQGRAILTQPIDVWFNGGDPDSVIISVRPRPSSAESEPDEENNPGSEPRKQSLALVIFLEHESDARRSSSPDDDDEINAESVIGQERKRQQQALLNQSHNEIQRLRNHLQMSAAEFEITNEELKLANEELQSTNEEYRSTMEELETSKEELQSVNEELITVNDELKHKMTEVIKAHDDLENLISSTQIATLFLDREMRIKLFTPMITPLFNMMISDLERPINHLTHYLQYDTLLDDANQVLQSLRSIEREIQNNDGHYFLMRISPYRTKNDRIEGVVITFVDINQLKDAQSTLKETEIDLETSKTLYRRLFDRMIEGLILIQMNLDDNGTLLDYQLLEVNPAYEKIFQTTANSLSAKKAFEAHIFSQYSNKLESVLATGTPVTFSTYVPEIEAHFQISIFSPVADNLAILLSDISELKRAEFALTEINETLEAQVAAQAQQIKKVHEAQSHKQKLESLGILAGGIAHDFNNLLMPMMLFSQLGMDTSKGNEKTFNYFKQIHQVSGKAAKLTRQILAFSRKQPLEMRIVQVNSIVTNLIDMLQGIVLSDVDLQINLAENLSVIMGDSTLLEQVLINLVVNATEAIEKSGRIIIETAMITMDETTVISEERIIPGEYVILSVQDNGQGMSEETRQRIFEPFYSTKKMGLGLGLSTTYGIVHQHDGYISTTSQLNEGTTIRVYLPAEALQKTVVLKDKPPFENSGLEGLETVLVVEDDSIIQVLLKNILTTNGYQIIEANNGLDALNLAVVFDGKIDLLLTDVIMPGMSGNELAQQMLAQIPSIKVIYMSGYTKDKINLSENVNFLMKPFSSYDLLKKVREVLDK